MAKIIWETRTSVGEFFARRFIRIAPLYFSVTLLVFGIAFVFPSLMGTTTADPLQLLYSLLFLPYTVDGASVAPTLSIGWTLNYEMFFYVCIAIFTGLMNDRKLFKTAFVLSALVVLGLIWQPQNGFAKFYTDPILLEFVFGIIIFYIWRKTENKPAFPIYLVLFMCALGIIVYQFNQKAGDWRVLYWGLPSAVLLLSSLHVLTFKFDWLRRLGDASYAIYLLHLFVIMGVFKILLPLVPIALPWQLHYIVMTALLLSASWIVHFYIDRPVMRTLTNLAFGSRKPQAR